jgi:hypothetical protein
MVLGRSRISTSLILPFSSDEQGSELESAFIPGGQIIVKADFISLFDFLLHFY